MGNHPVFAAFVRNEEGIRPVIKTGSGEKMTRERKDGDEERERERERAQCDREKGLRGRVN